MEELTKEYIAFEKSVQFLMLANDVLSGKIFDFVSEIKKFPKIYRHYVKRNVNQLELSRKQYDSRVKIATSILEDNFESHFSDVAQKMEDEITSYYNHTRSNVLDELTKMMPSKDHDEIEMMSYMIVISAMSRILTKIYEKIEALARKQGKVIYTLNMYHVVFNINRVKEDLSVLFGCEKEFLISEQIRLEFHTMFRKMIEINKNEKL